MKPSDPLLLANGTLRCGMYPAGKVAIPSVTILSVSSVWTLVVKYSRPPDLKSSSNVSLLFALDYRARNRRQLKFVLILHKTKSEFCQQCVLGQKLDQTLRSIFQVNLLSKVTRPLAQSKELVGLRIKSQWKGPLHFTMG